MFNDTTFRIAEVSNMKARPPWNFSGCKVEFDAFSNVAESGPWAVMQQCKEEPPDRESKLSEKHSEGLKSTTVKFSF